MAEVLVKPLSNYDVDELSDFLLDEGVAIDTAKEFERNKIGGKAFLNLTEEDLKELVPLIGLRASIRDILKKVSLRDTTDVMIIMFLKQEKGKCCVSTSETLKVILLLCLNTPQS